MERENRSAPDGDRSTEVNVTVKTHEQDRRPDVGAGGTSGNLKRPYQRPAIISRELWEAVAGVCSGAGAKSTLGPCMGPLSS